MHMPSRHGWPETVSSSLVSQSLEVPVVDEIVGNQRSRHVPTAEAHARTDDLPARVTRPHEGSREQSSHVRQDVKHQTRSRRPQSPENGPEVRARPEGHPREMQRELIVRAANRKGLSWVDAAWHHSHTSRWDRTSIGPSRHTLSTPAVSDSTDAPPPRTIARRLSCHIPISQLVHRESRQRYVNPPTCSRSRRRYRGTLALPVRSPAQRLGGMSIIRQRGTSRTGHP